MKELEVSVAQGKTWKKFKKEVLNNWLLYLFMLPAIIFYIVFAYKPLYGLQIAFQNYRVGETFGQSEWVGLDNFSRFFESVWFGVLLKNTLTISLLNLVLGFPLPILLALALNEVKNMKFRKVVQSVTYAPHFISMVILCATVTMFLNPSTGLIGAFVNHIRGLWGLKSINLLTVGSAFKWIYVLSGVWQGIGWGSIIYMAALSAVDTQLLDAAKVDGASKLQCIWHINLPAIKPTIVIQLILSCGRMMSVGFEKVYLLQNDSIIRSSEVISTYVYRAGIQGAQYSFSTAVGLFNSVVNAILLVLVNKIAQKVDSESSLW